MNFNKTILKNGLRLITVPMKDNPTVTVLVLVEAGSKYEAKSENGISHFLEHMCFKGTLKRPSAYSISHELDGLGSQSNAFTSQEFTGYYAKSDARHFSKIFDVISDIYLNATLPASEIEKEKGVIVEEINMYEDLPHRHVQEMFMHLLYGDQPAGWDIAGTRENVKSFNRDNFVSYREKHYVPGKTVVVVSGSVNEEEVRQEVERAFGELHGKEIVNKVPVVETQSEPKVIGKFKETDQAHLVLGVRTFSIFDKRSRVAGVMATILAGGMSSRLFQKLREEMGVCYYVRSFNESFSDHGFLEVAVGCDTSRVEEVVKVILEEIKKMKDTPVSDEELGRVKEYIVGNMKLELESSDAYASFYGDQEVMRKEILKPEEIEKRIRAVTAEDIQKCAQEILIEKNLNMAIIGPYKDTEVFKGLLKF